MEFKAKESKNNLLGDSSSMLNPWADIGSSFKEIQSISLEKLEDIRNRQLENGKRRNKKVNQRIKSHEIKERDYETYNYHYEEDSDKNDRSNILQHLIRRSHERRLERKTRQERYDEQQIERKRMILKLEKKKNDREKKRHNDQLIVIKEKFETKKINAELKRRHQIRMQMMVKIASEFNVKLLLKNYFRRFKCLILLKKKKEHLASLHYDSYLTSICFSKLNINKNRRVEEKLKKATAFYDKLLLKQSLQQLKKFYDNRRLEIRKAVDFYEKRLTKSYIKYWKRHTENNHLITMSNLQTAKQHYERLLVRQSFAKLRRWFDHRRCLMKENQIGFQLRWAVKNILPDFDPSSSDDEDYNGDKHEDVVISFRRISL